MKIQGPKQTSPTRSTQKSGSVKRSESGDFGEYMAAGSVREATTTSAPKSVAAVDALLAVQSVEDPTEKAAKKRMIHRADDVLEELDGLHMAMLKGSVSMSHMIGIADKVAAHKERVRDKKLSDLLDEIDLRAQVELAKMRKALDKS